MHTVGRPIFWLHLKLRRNDSEKEAADAIDPPLTCRCLVSPGALEFDYSLLQHILLLQNDFIFLQFTFVTSA